MRKIIKIVTVWMIIVCLVLTSSEIQAERKIDVVPSSELNNPSNEEPIGVTDSVYQEQGGENFPEQKLEDVNLNRNQPYSSFFEFEEGRITKQINLFSDGYEEIISYIYDIDGSVRTSSSVFPPSDDYLFTNESINIQGEPEDSYIYDLTVKAKLNALTDSAGQAEQQYKRGLISQEQKIIIHENLGDEADELRVSYIISNPHSEYAKRKLGGSSRQYPLIRALRYNASNPYEGMDVKVIQRVLELYEYIDSLDGSSYGIYDEETEDAVKRYQRVVMGQINPDGIVGEQTYNSLFSSTSNNMRTSFNIMQLRLARSQHNLVQSITQKMLESKNHYGPCNKSTSYGVCTEVYIPGGGRSGGRGYGDIVDLSQRKIWEVKPDTQNWIERSRQGRQKGVAQLERYINTSKSSTQYIPYFPLNAGDSIQSYRIRWNQDEDIAVRPGDLLPYNSINESGMIYYKRVTKKHSPNTPIIVPEPAKQKQSNPDPKTIAEAAGVVGVLVVIYNVGKAVVTVAVTRPAVFLNISPPNPNEIEI
ncbi:putative peptidoglycan binding domain protein [compost metagenome]